MNKQADRSSEQRASDFNKNDDIYSVEQVPGMTIGELIDGIRDKIQTALESQVSQTDNYSGK